MAETPKLSRRNLELHGIFFDDHVHANPSDLESSSAERGHVDEEGKSGFESNRNGERDHAKGRKPSKLPDHVDALRKALLCFGTPVPVLKRMSLEQERKTFIESSNSSAAKLIRKARSEKRATMLEELSLIPPSSVYGLSDVERITKGQNRKYNRFQDVAILAKERVDDVEDEENWTTFLENNLFERFKSTEDTPDLLVQLF